MIEQEWREFIAECVERMNAIADKVANRRSKILTGKEQAEFDTLEQWATDARDQADRLAEITELVRTGKAKGLPVTGFYTHSRTSDPWGEFQDKRGLLNANEVRSLAAMCVEQEDPNLLTDDHK